MDRNCRIVGFLGMDKYEYIIYLSRVLYHLGKKVLMVDCSETGALTASIPCPEGIMNSVIEYRGVMFIDCRNLNQGNSYYLLESTIQDKEYDFILIDYGYFTNAGGINNCDQLVIVTDQQAHSIARITIPKHLKDITKSLIIKNVVRSKISPKYILNELKLDYLSAKQTYVVYQDELDMECRINCQYDGAFRFIKLSTQSKIVLKGLTTELLPEITKKVYKTAYKKAERGVWHHDCGILEQRTWTAKDYEQYGCSSSYDSVGLQPEMSCNTDTF